MRVIICGGGVIGASIAFFLARRGVAATVVERTGIANAASGKSGGFLAFDWCDGGPLQALARRSFELHAALAAELGGAAWGYRRMEAYSAYAQPGTHFASAAGVRPWLSDAVAPGRALGTDRTTAQVHPALFTRAMMAAAEAGGASVVAGTVTGLRRSADGASIAAVEVDGEALPCDAAVIAMGPWSILAAAWLPLPAVYGMEGHSLVFETGDAVPAEAIFLDVAESAGASHPEIFPRADGTTYVCAGFSSDAALPVDPAEVLPKPATLARLEAIARAVSPALAAAPIRARQACFRPVTEDGLPLIGAVPGLAGAYVATGHSVWGILNAPATGEAMAGLILDGRARLDLSAFDPGRTRPFDARRLRAAGAGA